MTGRHHARLQAWALRAVYPAMILAAGAAIALGVFRDLAPSVSSPVARACAVALGVLLLGRLIPAVAGRAATPVLPPTIGERGEAPNRASASERAALRADLELGGMMLACFYAAFQATGGARSLIHPLAYAVVAFAVTSRRRRVGLPLVAWAAVLECALYLASPTGTAGLHAAQPAAQRGRHVAAQSGAATSGAATSGTATSGTATSGTPPARSRAAPHAAPVTAAGTPAGRVTSAEAGSGSDELLLASHLAFLALFAALHVLVLGAELLRQRRDHRARLDGEVRRIRDEARDFRLIGTQLPSASRAGGRPREVEQEIIAAASVDSIHQALFYTLELLKKSLDLHTAVLLWLDEGGEQFHIKELASDSDALQPAPIPADSGLLGAIVRDKIAVRVRDPRAEHLPYYASPQPIGAFCAVPVLEGGGEGGAQGGGARALGGAGELDSHAADLDGPRFLRAILCADRLVTRAADGIPTAVPFDARDEQLLAGAAREILRAVRAERIFVTVERGKYEHEALFRASDQLNRALTPEQVFDTAFAAARELCNFDFAAITRFDPLTRRHAVVAAMGDGKEEVEGLSFGDNAGLVAMAIKNRHALPAVPHGEARREAHGVFKDQPIFTRKPKLRGLESLLVLPLVAADEPIGAMVLGARAARRFSKDKRELLGVIANQVAVSARNAETYRAMEQMATTDGLTGLVNHRSFQERFADLLSRAERQGQPVSLLLTDIDHFKKVNDSYGHPTGDVVLKGVAAVCREQVRKIDVAARYGGEEFAIVLDGTDREGALLLAERIRREVAARTFQSADQGPFSCTLSLGISSYPDDGKDPKALIAHADQALYHAKHSGRNRAIAWANLEGKQLLLRAVK